MGKLQKVMNRKNLLVILFLLGIFFLSGCESKEQTGKRKEQKTKYTYINKEGNTLETRIQTPEGYTRNKVSQKSLTEFLRTYKMKPDQSKVLLYNGKEKGYQNAQTAIFKLPLEQENLQQCADSVMRVYAEYFWKMNQYDKISFQLSDGFEAKYSKWREGYRIVPGETSSYWTKSAGRDTSYGAFQKYLRIVFAYAGTASMGNETKSIKAEDIQVGDVFLKSGSPGHVVMVVDICENKNGDKAFLLAQGYMPAQEFHVLKNPKHEENPWYRVDEISYPFKTPQYTFQKGSLKRLSYHVI
ncbi:MAG: DUF4846 domain-containing protein [Anaerostipes sp.]|nr:DUF4846 domain-containing protein [Anaerostipes sp.]